MEDIPATHARRSLSFTVHVTAACPDGSTVALSLVRSEWHPGKGSHAIAVRHEVVTPAELDRALMEIVTDCQRLEDELRGHRHKL